MERRGRERKRGNTNTRRARQEQTTEVWIGSKGRGDERGRDGGGGRGQGRKWEERKEIEKKGARFKYVLDRHKWGGGRVNGKRVSLVHLGALDL